MGKSSTDAAAKENKDEGSTREKPLARVSNAVVSPPEAPLKLILDMYEYPAEKGKIVWLSKLGFQRITDYSLVNLRKTYVNDDDVQVPSTDDQKEALQIIRKMPYLERFSLDSGASLELEDLELAMKNINDMNQVGLKGLDLTSGHIGDDGFSLIAQSPKLHSLVNLSLPNCNLDKMDASPFKTWNHLALLDLARNNLDPPVLERIIRQLPGTLKDLNLNANGVGAPGANAIVGLNIPNLQELHLEGCRIPKAGGEAIAEALGKNWPNLRVLDISKNSFWNSKAPATLVKNLPHSLTHLKVGHSMIFSDEDIRVMGQRIQEADIHLEHLDLSGCDVPGDALLGLLPLLPSTLKYLGLDSCNMDLRHMSLITELVNQGHFPHLEEISAELAFVGALRANRRAFTSARNEFEDNLDDHDIIVST